MLLCLDLNWEVVKVFKSTSLSLNWVTGHRANLSVDFVFNHRNLVMWLLGEQVCEWLRKLSPIFIIEERLTHILDFLKVTSQTQLVNLGESVKSIGVIPHHPSLRLLLNSILGENKDFRIIFKSQLTLNNKSWLHVINSFHLFLGRCFDCLRNVDVVMDNSSAFWRLTKSRAWLL